MATFVCFSGKFEAFINKVKHFPKVESTTWWIFSTLIPTVALRAQCPAALENPRKQAKCKCKIRKSVVFCLFP